MDDPIDTADHVEVDLGQEKEVWLVAMVERGMVTCCGWPESMIEVGRCRIVHKATDDERLSLLREMAKSTGRRAEYAQSKLAEIGKEQR